MYLLLLLVESLSTSHLYRWAQPLQQVVRGEEGGGDDFGPLNLVRVVAEEEKRGSTVLPWEKVLSTFLFRLLLSSSFRIPDLCFPRICHKKISECGWEFCSGTADRVLFAGGLGKGSGKLLFYRERATLDANTVSVRKRRRTVSLKIQCFVQTPLSYITYLHLLFAVGGECVFLKRRRPFPLLSESPFARKRSIQSLAIPPLHD